MNGEKREDRDRYGWKFSLILKLNVYSHRREKTDKMTYKRTVDKAEIPICNIMGVNIAAINMKWLLDYLEKIFRI